jgi:SAM-dependent MidA family methyltransferase
VNKLEKIIFDLIDKKEKITFKEFMELSLYYPELGYYQKDNPFGTQGSFYTSVNASQSFGNTLATAYKNTIETLKLESNICEMGAGSGLLANDILNFSQKNFPDFYSKLTYHIIEKSTHLIERQKELLKPHLEKIKWTTFEDLKNFNGVFHSNELVDAFPVHRLIKIDDEIKEIYVINNNGKLDFFPDKLSTPKLQDYINKIGIKPVNKQMFEINLDAVDWIKSLGKKLQKGIIVTIDYGYPANQLYASFRMDGTVTCYFQHRQNNFFFQNIGYQDITAFVDFTALEKFGQEAGLEKVAFMQQWLFLVQSGILEEVKKAKTDLHKSSIKSLIMPEGGFGTTFHVLIQSKNLKIPNDFMYKKSAYETLSEMAKVFEGTL